jgi:hypothetical protein
MEEHMSTTRIALDIGGTLAILLLAFGAFKAYQAALAHGWGEGLSISLPLFFATLGFIALPILAYFFIRGSDYDPIIIFVVGILGTAWLFLVPVFLAIVCFVVLMLAGVTFRAHKALGACDWRQNLPTVLASLLATSAAIAIPIFGYIDIMSAARNQSDLAIIFITAVCAAGWTLLTLMVVDVIRAGPSCAGRD